MASHQGEEDFSEEGEFVDAPSEYMEMPALSPMWRTVDRTGELDSFHSDDHHAASLTREISELHAGMSRLRDLQYVQSTPV